MIGRSCQQPGNVVLAEVPFFAALHRASGCIIHLMAPIRMHTQTGHGGSNPP